MTWSRVRATGSGKLEFRVVIEGWPYQFVSAVDMEQTLADGRVRVACLQRDGIAIEEQAIPHEATIESSGMTLSLIDRHTDDTLTRALTTRPTATTWLTADASTTATSIAVADVTGFSSGDVVHIGTEAIRLGASPSGTTMGTLTRAYWDSIAQAHYTEDGDNLLLPAVTNQPITMEGRRAYLYVYGDGDDPLGDGSLIWRGICATDAKLNDDGATWSILIDPITGLLEQDLGADLEEDARPRGIYYHASAPLMVGYWDGPGTGPGSGAPPVSVHPYEFIYGYFPDNRALCDAINASFAALITATGSTVQRLEAVPIGDVDYEVHVTVSSTDPRYPLIVIESPVDGLLYTILFGIIDTAGNVTYTVSAGGTYVARFADGNRTVPRGFFGRCTHEYAYPFERELGDFGAYPEGRVYVGGTVAVDDLAGAEIELDGGDVSISEFAFVADKDPAERSVTFIPPFDGAPYSAVSPLKMKFVRLYAVGGLDDFFLELTGDSPSYANKGGGPFVTDSDVSLSDFVSTVERLARGRASVTERYYFSRESVSLAEYVAHECRLIGAYLGTTSDGKIRPVQLRQVAPTELAVATVDDANTLIDDGWPTYERNAWGTINSVSIHSAYLIKEDEWRRRDVIRDVTSYSLRKRPKVLEIKPRSAGIYEWDIAASYRDHVETASIPLGVFGRDYAVVTVGVPLTLFDALIGDVVALTGAHLPAMDGTRGVDAARAIVVGRRWDLDQGRGMLTLLLTLEDIAGYTPSVTVTGQSNVGGNQWDLTVTSNAPFSTIDLFPSGATLGSFFGAGDSVRVSAWGNPAVSALTGKIDSVSGTATNPATGTIRVTFDSSWTPSTHTWVIDYGSAPDADASQQAYAYWSTPAMRISFATERPARVWGA